MDRGVLALLIPIVAMCIPIAAIVMHGIQQVWRVRLEEARTRAAASTGGSERIETLEGEIAEIRQELGEVQERLDFTERALVQARERARLPES